MLSQKLLRHAVAAQLLIFIWILLKVFLLPYLIWSFLGTAPAAVRAGDLAVIVLGTCAALSLGAIGYFHAARFSAGRSPVAVSLLLMFIVHAPLFIYLVYKWLYAASWESAIHVIFSGWLSIVAHPMILVGVFGKWAELLGALLLCGSYLLGVWMYFDEHNVTRRRGLRMK